ncbi:hypothetical protein LCGC14_0971130 [marine sediment metagenome]|uniref:Uncharacterized protein n=1 Tax=marine sediment metagenome TaxID=412755 RepID=A0A0F9RI10_9ZZZZ
MPTKERMIYEMDLEDDVLKLIVDRYDREGEPVSLSDLRKDAREHYSGTSSVGGGGMGSLSTGYGGRSYEERIGKILKTLERRHYIEREDEGWAPTSWLLGNRE